MANRQPKGGLGGNFSPEESEPDEKTIRLTRMLERAARERWPIPEEMRAKIIARMGKIATNPRASNRHVTAAVRCLIQMDALNLQKLDQDIAKLAEGIVNESGGGGDQKSEETPPGPEGAAGGAPAQ